MNVACLLDRIYLRGVTEINKSWLPKLAGEGPMCVFSSPLESPQPFYDRQKEMMMCYVIPRFGPHLWELSAYLCKFPRDDNSIYKWFGKQLLEGKVIPELMILTTFYSSSPSMLTKPQLPIKGMALVNALRREKVTARSELLEKWKKNKLYLKAELTAWVLPRYLEILNTIWPFIVAGKSVPDPVLNEIRKKFDVK